jgi:hypothetical protein
MLELSVYFQIDVFLGCLYPYMHDVISGHQQTVFVFGQSGTGKTYTMEGGHRINDDVQWYFVSMFICILLLACFPFFRKERLLPFGLCVCVCLSVCLSVYVCIYVCVCPFQL